MPQQQRILRTINIHLEMIDNSNRNDSEVIMTMIQLVTEIVIMLITIRPSYLISYKKNWNKHTVCFFVD